MRVQQIAYDLGVTDRTYYLWENHSISPSLEKALRIAAYFEVKVEDLQKGSGVKVDCICDGCGKELNWSFFDYNRIVKENGETYCNSCSVNLTLKGEAFYKSFYQWCIEHSRQGVLDRWDYELNRCSPNDISYGSNNKYWFKCDKYVEHKSELKRILNFVKGI